MKWWQIPINIIAVVFVLLVIPVFITVEIVRDLWEAQ